MTGHTWQLFTTKPNEGKKMAENRTDKSEFAAFDGEFVALLPATAEEETLFLKI